MRDYWINMNLNIGKSKYLYFYGFFSLFLLLLFGFKDIMVLSSKIWPHLYAVVNTPRASWEEVYCYHPFVFTGWSFKIMFYPLITLAVQKVMFKYLCLSNIDLYLFLMHTVFPVASFWLLYFVYRRYVARSWSVLLAFLGVVTFPNISFFHYFIRVLADPFSAVNLSSLSPMELTRVPIPSFSFFFFILTFFLSTMNNKPTKRQYVYLSVLWALNLYVYLYNFIAGIMFWFLYIVYTRYVKDKHLDLKRIATTVVLNMAAVLLVISPLLLKKLLVVTPLDSEILQRMGLTTSSAGIFVSHWGWFTSYIFPLLAVLIVVGLFCADYYELVYKFSPIFILIAVELLVSNIHLIYGVFFEPYLFSMRIADYFLRYLYFIPIIYFLSQPYKRLFHGNLIAQFADGLNRICVRLIIERRRVIAAAGIIIISIFIILSGMRYKLNYEDNVVGRMEKVEAKLQALTVAAKNGRDMVVSDDIAVDLLIPVRGGRETLLLNAFSNYIPGDEILSRIMLFAHIFNWNEQRFLAFMMPNNAYKGFNTENAFIVSDNILNNGFGYWLLNHHKNMDKAALQEYQTRIISAYRKYDLMANVRKYRIAAVHSAGAISAQLPIDRVSRTKYGNIFVLKGI